ncbi:NADH-quinone oxidoreductase subunit L [candidate division KSB1 bacterium]|nr:MAG: NADH-quinone oxidoreductase subunit L [candidate division KSB1 bacterium]
MLAIVLSILLAPLAAFALVIFFGRWLPRGGDWVSLIAIWGGLGLSLYLFFARILVAYNPTFLENFSFDWLVWGDYRLTVGIALDNMAVMMLVVVTLVSAVVHLFSIGYMKGDPRYSQFFAYLSFFSFSMLGLVLADNLLVIYAFWELVGLSSYLLIGFWYEKDSASDAGKKAFITNRVGDAGMLVGILLVFTVLGTMNLREITEGVAAGKLSGGLLTTAGICLFLGAVGKSAQFPLHVWLPDAMEGPTPVSALIHAATMVAAGVYLTARIFVILTVDASLVIAYVGGFTAIFAATIAVAQNDIKRVLAYSTVSQLGYMVMALGVGAYTAGFFHLVTHAMFKACLFLGSGSVIHALHHALHHAGSHADAQDLRNMGGLRKRMPLTFWTFLIATVALSGVPLTSGFISKDAILGGTLAFVMEHPVHWPLALFGFCAAALTAFYMFRLVYLAFAGTFRGSPQAESHLRESPAVITAPLIILSTLCFFAFFTLPALNPTTPEGGWFAHLFPNPPRAYETALSGEHAAVAGHGAEAATESLHHTAHNAAMLISILVAGLGIWIATLGYYWKRISPAYWQTRFGVLYRGMFHKWWSDEIYDATVIKGTLGFSRLLAWFDLRGIDGVVNGSAWLTRWASVVQGWFDLRVVDGLVNRAAWFVGVWGKFVRRFQSGQIQRYIFYSLLVVGIVVVLNWFGGLR